MIKMTQPKIKTRGKKLYLSFSLDGKQKRKSLNLDDTKANRALVEKKIIPELLIKVHSGEFFKNNNTPTVDEFAEKSFMMNKASLKKLTHKKYMDMYRLHIQPIFGKMKITAIKRSDLLSWQNNLTVKLAGNTIKGIRAVLMIILEDALKDELIDKNYLHDVKPPKIAPVIEVKPFTIQEIYSILDGIAENMRAFFAIGFFTGMRPGEIIALKWSEVDLENKIIHVRHSIRNNEYTEPKTKSSIRDIEILDVLLPYLVKHRSLISDDTTFVFETYKGKPYRNSDKISLHYWKKTLEAQNIEYRNLYQMRHTFTSQMLSNGEDILWVSNMLGHKDSSTTLERYAKYIPNKKAQRAQFLKRKTA